jgi:hypothetical protein
MLAQGGQQIRVTRLELLEREAVRHVHEVDQPEVPGAEHDHLAVGDVAGAAAVALGRAGAHYLEQDRVEGEDPLAPFGPPAARHLLRTHGFPHVADIMVGSFYDPALDEGCAFEELISFHGGLGGPQTRPFLLYGPHLPAPEQPIVGAAAMHAVLRDWRDLLASQGDGAAASLTDAGANTTSRTGRAIGAPPAQT